MTVQGWTVTMATYIVPSCISAEHSFLLFSFLLICYNAKSGHGGNSTDREAALEWLLSRAITFQPCSGNEPSVLNPPGCVAQHWVPGSSRACHSASRCTGRLRSCTWPWRQCRLGRGSCRCSGPGQSGPGRAHSSPDRSTRSPETWESAIQLNDSCKFNISKHSTNHSAEG